MSRQDKIVDPFLQKVLEQHRGQSEFSDILRSIQNEQNDIVDFDFNKNIIVQGCAGSGKTMILFHRLANMLYNIDTMSKSIKASQIVIIIPNDSFKKYLENLTWSLGVDKIKMMTFDEYLKVKLLDVVFRLFKTNSSDSDRATERKKEEKDETRNTIKEYLKLDIKESAKEMVFDDVTKKSIQEFVNKYESEHHRMVSERNKELERRKDLPKTAEHRNWLKRSMEDIRQHRVDSESEFFDTFFGGEINRSYLIGFLSTIGSDDALSYYKPSSDRILMIDEGQDYGMLEYNALKMLNPGCIFNIFGDTDQKVFDRGLENWSEIKDLFQADYFTLNQDYRNSNQIVDYVNSTLGKNIMPIGFDTKDVEEVELKKLPIYLQYERNMLKHKVAIVTDRPNFYAKVPEDVTVLSVQQIKGLEFDTVFISPEIQSLDENFRYVALTRALSDLYILK